MALDVAFIIPSFMKLILIITVGIILYLVDPVYTISYYSAGIESSWGAIFIYIISSFTLFYVVASIVAQFVVRVNCSEKLHGCGITECVICSGFTMSWLLISGYAGSVSWRSGQDSSTQFGWISALAAINVLIFLMLTFMSCFGVASQKINKRRNGGGNIGNQHYRI